MYSFVDELLELVEEGYEGCVCGEGRGGGAEEDIVGGVVVAV